jgi:hypothetical protein
MNIKMAERIQGIETAPLKQLNLSPAPQIKLNGIGSLAAQLS